MAVNIWQHIFLDIHFDACFTYVYHLGSNKSVKGLGNGWTSLEWNMIKINVVAPVGNNHVIYMPFQQYVSIMLYIFTYHVEYSLHSCIIDLRKCKLEFITYM